MSKGSRRRKTNEEVYKSNWDKIFGEKERRGDSRVDRSKDNSTQANDSHLPTDDEGDKV
jgi:hypothetical protein